MTQDSEYQNRFNLRAIAPKAVGSHPSSRSHAGETSGGARGSLLEGVEVGGRGNPPAPLGVGLPKPTNPESLSHSLLPVALFLSRSPLCFRRATRGTRFAGDDMGIVVGPLLKRRSRWLLVGVTSIHLPRRMTCALTIGTLVRVAYTEREGRRLVEAIQPLPESPPVPRRRP